MTNLLRQMVNNLGINPDEWFQSEKKEPPSWDWEDTAPSEYEPPDDWFNDKPEPKEETIHEKMYQMAIQKHSPWKGGGSENFQGGSENLLNSN